MTINSNEKAENVFRIELTKFLANELIKLPEALAVWEGGSAANKTSDQYSDLDLCILVHNPSDKFVELIEAELRKFSEISHIWNISKRPYGKGLIKIIYTLENAPKYFFLDLTIFTQDMTDLLKSYLEIERHGTPVIHFDKNDILIPQSVNQDSFLSQQKMRIDEIIQSFPVYKTIVLKEIERENAIDAIAFYHNGLVRPLSEVLGILYRPLQYDFNLRYFHRAFPKDIQTLMQSLCYIADLQDLKRKVVLADTEFSNAIGAYLLLRETGAKNIQGALRSGPS